MKVQCVKCNNIYDQKDVIKKKYSGICVFFCTECK